MRIVIPLNERFYMRLFPLLPRDLNLILTLKEPWMVLSLSFACENKLYANGEGIQSLFPELSGVHNSFASSGVTYAQGGE